jgi:mannosyltransferase OCH1-like enzyme
MNIMFYLEPIYFYLKTFLYFLLYSVISNKKDEFIKNEDFIKNDTINDTIPKVLYMCCKDKNSLPPYVVNNWKKLNPKYTIHVSDNLDCINFLEKSYSKKHVDVFNYIKDGPIKSDFWRVCILNYYGGIYSDIDIEPIAPLDSILHNNISFLTVKRSMDYMFNPHFIASSKNNIILQLIIDKYILYYDTNISYKYWRWSILSVSQSILNESIGYCIREGFYKYSGGYCKIITENISINNLLFNRYKAYNSYDNKLLFKTRYLSYDEFLHTY